ncbi:MAG: hypothetical protein Q9223_005755 [Gallowayella weberi]
MPSTARSHPSNAGSHQASRSTNLFAYQPLTHPLNLAAQHALHNLPTTHTLTDLKRRLNAATEHLTNITGDLNDQHQLKKAEYEKVKARQAARPRDLESSQGGRNDEDDESDRRMEDAWNHVEEWTTKMDEGTRRVIDIQARVESTETTLKELDANVSHGRTATQSTLGASQLRSRSQRQPRQPRQLADDEDGDEDADSDADEHAAFTGPPALQVFKSKVAAASETYNSLPPRDRYASHNAYIGFRKIVHDARHPDDDTPMPHASTWFSSSSGPPTTQRHKDAKSSKPGSRSAPNDPNDSASNDEDLQIAQEKRSIRCPLTLLPLVSPLTSTLCPHSFESEAILGMLSASPLRADGSTGYVNRPGERAMKCPVCEKLLTKECLTVDPILVRKIKRIEERERRAREGVEDEDDEEVVVDREGIGGGFGADGVEEVTSSPVMSRREADVRKVKRERLSQVRGTGREREREVSLVPDSQVVDLGDGDEEEEEEEE